LSAGIQMPTKAFCAGWIYPLSALATSAPAPLRVCKSSRGTSLLGLVPNHEVANMLTIGRLAKRFGLSRSALLYYDRIGLLSPTGRTESNYRVYSDSDVDRLMRIDTFRQAGVPLNDIGKILDADDAGLRAILEARLRMINEGIAALRVQQRLIARLLRDKSVLRRTGSLDKDGWVAVLRASGMSDDDMSYWHAQFERLNPEAHRDFLMSLGIVNEEVDEIRARARRSS
jgi:DNA-binding transcriptional MerR regulator